MRILDTPTLALSWGPFAWSTATMVVAVASMIACVALLILSRTRWGSNRPTHRYAAISLAAHLLLLCLASSVRYGSAPFGDDEVPPVTVRIVMREPTEEPVAEEEPTESPAQEMLEEQDPQPDTTAFTEPLVEEPEAPPTLDVAEEVDEAVRQEANLDQPVELPQEALSAEAPSTPLPTTEAAVPLPPIEPIPYNTAPAPNAVEHAAPRTAYTARGEQMTLEALEAEGGDRQTEEAVAAGLGWLARAQRPDGAWEAVRWGAGRERNVLEHDRGGAGARAETGLTALALLAMQGAGHTHLDGQYRDTVATGLQFLINSQARNGELSGEATHYARTYCHSMATFALAEALALTGDQRLRPAVEAGVGFLVRSQSASTGGWRYRPGDRGDMSQMGWVVMALRSAELGGVHVPARTWRGVERFLWSVRRGQHRGLASYQPKSEQPNGPITPTMTAEALYCRQILGAANASLDANREAIDLLSGAPPSDRPANLYYWYYAMLALHHNRHADHHAKTAWMDWNTRLKTTLLPMQVRSGQNAGSWSPTTLWGGYGGRVYTTAMSTMCLEVYYRYDGDLVGRDPWLATRPSDAPLRR